VLTLEVPMSGMPNMTPQVTCSGCSASYSQNNKKMFLKEEKICYKIILQLAFKIS